MVRCLLELNMIEESRAYLSAFKGAFPDHANSRWVIQIQMGSNVRNHFSVLVCSSCTALESEVERKINKKKREAATEGNNGTNRDRKIMFEPSC